MAIQHYASAGKKWSISGLVQLQIYTPGKISRHPQSELLQRMAVQSILSHTECSNKIESFLKRATTLERICVRQQTLQLAIFFHWNNKYNTGCICKCMYMYICAKAVIAMFPRVALMLHYMHATTTSTIHHSFYFPDKQNRFGQQPNSERTLVSVGLFLSSAISDGRFVRCSNNDGRAP